VHAAQERWKERTAEGPVTATGVDVARGGKDKTVIARRYGTYVADLEKHAGSATPDGQAVAGLVLARPSGSVHVDAIGVGASVVDQLRGKADRLRAVMFSGEPPGRDRTGVLTFVNVRAWAYWALREALDPQTGDDLALPPDPELVADLCSARWTMRTDGVLVERKEDIVKRIGRSPDAGEAVVLAMLPPAETREAQEYVMTTVAQPANAKEARWHKAMRGGVNPFAHRGER
jgi:hypothetical protein